MNRTLTSIAALLALVVLFFALNIVVQRTATTARIDLTDGRLYTLSDGSRNIARSLKEPVRLTLYYSASQSGQLPQIKAYAPRVKDILREYARASGGQIQLDIVDPEPFSDAEDRAVQAGLASIPVGRGSDRFYFGLVAVNSTDRQETIPFFDPSKETFLEYDLTRLVYLLSDAPKKAVGLMTWLPIDGQAPANPMMGRGAPAYQIHTQIKELFDIRPVPTDAIEIPADIGTLLVVHPKGISPQTQYALDQFVLRGGRLLALVDPLCESDTPPGMNPMQAMQMPKASALDTLLSAWGVEMVKDKIAADRTFAIRVNAATAQNRPEAVDYVAWLNLRQPEEGAATRPLNADDPITGQLQNLVVATAGILRPATGATTTFTPLATTSGNAMAIEAASVSFFPEPKKLLAEFKPEGSPLTVAGRITGAVKSAFPDGFPAPPTPPADASNPNPPEPKKPTQAHIAESSGPINVIIVADCDFIADRFWTQEERLGPITLGFRKVSDNGDFVIGALDNLSGSSDLMSLRARGRSARPFETVLAMQRDAEQRYAAKEQELQSTLRDTEQKLAELQRKRSDDDKGLLLTPEQQAEVERFRAQMLETRKELRRVQASLREEIDQLGSTVKAINMGLMPAVVGVGALSLAAYRGARRRSDRQAAAAKE